jgi:hypothetical protein
MWSSTYYRYIIAAFVICSLFYLLLFIVLTEGDTASSMMRKDRVIPNNLNILVVNYHYGVQNELNGVLSQMASLEGINLNITHIRGFHRYRISKSDALGWYQLHKDFCGSNRFDIIIVGDTISSGRPFMEAHCKRNVILYITNRFDYGNLNDKEYHRLVENVSNWSNVRVLENNKFESYYAKKWRNVKLNMYAYIPSAGLISNIAQEMFINRTVKLPPSNDNDIFIVDKYFERPNVIQPLKKLNISVTVLQDRNYGGPLNLKNRILIHVPYQVNTMALFENLNMNVIYLLPSFKLYQQWIKRGSASISGISLTDNEFFNFVDWYRKDMSHLFFYFDSIEDLRPNSTFRRMVFNQANEKRAIIKKYMEQHIFNVINAWKKTIYSFYKSDSNSSLHKQ